MIPAYRYAPPYEEKPFPVLIWNAYAPSFHPHQQINQRMDPYGYTLTIEDRASFYWPGIFSGEIVSDDLRCVVDSMWW